MKPSSLDMALAGKEIDTDVIFMWLHWHEYQPTIWQRFKRLFWKKTDTKNINTDAKAVGYE